MVIELLLSKFYSCSRNTFKTPVLSPTFWQLLCHLLSRGWHVEEPLRAGVQSSAGDEASLRKVAGNRDLGHRNYGAARSDWAAGSCLRWGSGMEVTPGASAAQLGTHLPAHTDLLPVSTLPSWTFFTAAPAPIPLPLWFHSCSLTRCFISSTFCLRIWWVMKLTFLPSLQWYIRIESQSVVTLLLVKFVFNRYSTFLIKL